MRIYRHHHDLPEHHLGAAIAIGNFDGVHLGHQKVINTAGEVARETGV
ncbi:MAG: adenylyltransferase/cytidyltransferase family protein, partial [Rhodospirillales bacterium]|nr:adenylyltransferase/cytidyltransferase family protein [Rhodospirillales bacterium]